MSRSVLIVDEPVDGHSFAVRWGLAQRGVETTHFSQVDFPQRSTASFDSLSNRFELTINDKATFGYDVIWNRRTSPVLPSSDLHPGDFALSQQIGAEFLRSLLDYHLHSAFWINPPHAKEFADRKTNQLIAAADVGFRVPATLVSNDPARIRAFSNQYRAVVKPLEPMRWDAGQCWINMRTTRVTSEMLKDDVSIRSCPMIYQEEVDKKHEYRVVVFGGEIVGVEIDSQRDPAARLDWRDVKSHTLKMAQVELPANLCEKIRNLMARLGIVFGSLDLAVTTDDEVAFFEVNEQGNFLWIELSNPEIALLDRMVGFMLSRDAAFQYQAPKNPLLFADCVRSGVGAQFINEARENHMPNYGIFCPQDESETTLAA